jgi:heterodisulfide reductase subunit A
MTSALAIADHGFPVSLVEQSEALGGNLRQLHRTLEGDSPQELLEQTVAKVEKHPNIQLHTKSKVVHSTGYAGHFSTVIEKEDGKPETIEHGVTILATGGREAKPDTYAYGESEAIMTQHELEEKIADGSLAPESLSGVAFIQCVGSREEPRNYCSRICCASSLKNALLFKEKNPDMGVYILYRDLMSFGFMESYYTEARKKGIVFIQYEVDDKPQVALEDGKPRITALDPILGRKVRLEPDVLVLATGIVPNNTEEMSMLFGVETNQDGFYQEAEYKWRPVDFFQEGVFMAGIGHSPRSIAESIATGQAAAQRSLRILSSDRIAAGHIVAEVRHSLCALCERCIEACPYGARKKDEEDGLIVVDELVCQGCGSCAAVCPNSASVLRDFRDQQMFDVIDSAIVNLLAS